MRTGKKVFEYRFFGYGGILVSSVALYGGPRPAAVFQADVMKYRETIDKRNASKLLLTDTAFEQVKAILQNTDVYSIKELDFVPVLDGYSHIFFFCNGSQEIELEGHNLTYCTNDLGRYPNSSRVIALLNRIGDVLIPLGVDQKCFKLDNEE